MHGPERRSPPPLVKEIRKAALAMAGVIGLWATTQAVLDYRTLVAVQQMKAKPDTVLIMHIDTLNQCGAHAHDQGTSPFPF